MADNTRTVMAKIIAIGFTGKNMAADGVLERRPFAWVVSFVQWGGRVLLWPCLECIKNRFPTFSDKLWAAWQGWEKGSAGLKSD